jgi:hypothetical protein
MVITMKRVNNKKGWIQIVEAVVAVLLVATVLLITINKGYIGKSDMSESVYKTELSILREIQTNDNFRTEIVTLCSVGQTCKDGGCINHDPRCTIKSDLEVCGDKICGIKQDDCGVQRICGSCPTGTACNPSQKECVGTCALETRTTLEICGNDKCGYAGDICGNPIVCGAPVESTEPNFPADINDKIKERTPNYLECIGKICDMKDTCILSSSSQQKDVYAQSVVISATLKQGAVYRQLKLFCWAK